MDLEHKFSKDFTRLATIAVCALLFTGLADGVLTVQPVNVIATVGQSVKLFCSSQSTNNASDIVWLQSSQSFVNNNPTKCSAVSRTDVVTTTGVNNCDVTFNPITVNDAGTMCCQDPLNGIGAFSTIVLLVEPPTCGVTPAATVVTRGSNVTIGCQFRYKLQSYAGQEYPAITNVSTQWSIPGQSTTPSVPVRAPSGITTHSLTTNVTVTATGSQLPAYNCTGFFTFQDPSDPRFTYALNTLNASCTTQPVTVQDANDTTTTTRSVTPPITPIPSPTPSTTSVNSSTPSPTLSTTSKPPANSTSGPSAAPQGTINKIGVVIGLGVVLGAAAVVSISVGIGMALRRFFRRIFRRRRRR